MSGRSCGSVNLLASGVSSASLPEFGPAELFASDDLARHVQGSHMKPPRHQTRRTHTQKHPSAERAGQRELFWEFPQQQ
ncbi:hypothetical protein CALCODRAFT_502416, partial [Calocera cornea HHB12733]